MSLGAVVIACDRQIAGGVSRLGAELVTRREAGVC